MMKQVLAYGVALAVLSGLAWAEWSKEPAVDLAGKVMLLDGKADDVAKISWKSEKEEALLERKTDAHGDYWWVTYTKIDDPSKKTEPADPHAPKDSKDAPKDATPDALKPPSDVPPADATTAPAEVPAEIKRTVTNFKAGKEGETLLKDFSPWLAVRKLDGVDATKLASIGLDAPKESLEITRGGRTLKYDFGGEAYGTKDRYIRNQETGEIFLVDDEKLRPLLYARTRLPDRNVFSLEPEKMAGATVAGPTKSAELLHKNKDDKDHASWVLQANPDGTAEQADTWMDKFLKLKSTTYVADADKPAGLVPQFTVTLRGDAGAPETVKVMRDGAEGDFYAESDHTRGLVKLLKSSTEALAQDADALADSGSGPAAGSPPTGGPPAMSPKPPMAPGSKPPGAPAAPAK